MMRSTFENYQRVYEMLEDEESREVYLNRLNYLISGNGKYVRNMVAASIKTGSTYGIGREVTTLRNTIPQDKRIVLYGAGSFGEYMLPYWEEDKRFSGFCCRTKEKQANGYLGYPAISPEELLTRRDLAVVISTTTFRDEILQILREGNYPENLIFEIPEFEVTDDPGQYFNPAFMKYEDGEVFVDAGCFNLSTSLELRNYCKHIEKIYAFEPDAQNYQNCVKRKTETNLFQANILPFGTWSEETMLHFQAKGNGSSCIDMDGNLDIPVMPIDSVVDAAERVTMIKMDVEGAELESLKGARETILRNRPKLAICIYHKPEDMTEIPLYIKSLVPEYKFFVRHHSNYFAETVLYAIVQ